MRIIIVIIFIVVCAYIGINTINGFNNTIENHNQRIERAAGY